MEMKLYCMQFIQAIKNPCKVLPLALHSSVIQTLITMGSSYISKLNIPTESLEKSDL